MKQNETGAIWREKILRENGVQLQIRKKIKEEISFLPDVRLYYIIEGMLKVQIGEKCYRMKKDDILLFNLDVSSGKAETVGEKNLICEISIDNRLLAELLENENGRFVCNSVEHPGQSYERMKKIIQQIWKKSCGMYTVIIRHISVLPKLQRSCTFQLLHYPDFLKSRQGCILRNMWEKYVCITRKMN